VEDGEMGRLAHAMGGIERKDARYLLSPDDIAFRDLADGVSHRRVTPSIGDVNIPASATPGDRPLAASC
jgi:hypothetical protein